MDVVMRVAEKLQRPDHHHLALYATWKASNEGKAFGDWMRIVLRNVARDVARAQLGPRRNEGDQPSVKRLLNELSSHVEVAALGTRPPYTDAQTARELLSFAGQKLTPPQLEALVGWVRGASFEELAQPLGVDAAAARNLVRAAIATLRRRFAP